MPLQKGVTPPQLLKYRFTKERAAELAHKGHKMRRDAIASLKAGLPIPNEHPNRLPLVQRSIERLSRFMCSPNRTSRELVALSNALDLLLERERILLGQPKPGTIHRAKEVRPEPTPQDLPEPE